MTCGASCCRIVEITVNVGENEAESTWSSDHRFWERPY